MRKLIVVLLIVSMLSGCSWKKVMKWIDEIKWERDDEIVHIIDVLPIADRRQ